MNNKMERKKSITKLKKIWEEKGTDSEEIPVEKRKIYLDPANVMGIIPKTHSARKILLDNFEAGKGKNIPILEYKCEEEAISKFSFKYFKWILDFTKCFSDEEDGCRLKVRKDYPLTIEMKYFDIILAPMIEVE